MEMLLGFAEIRYGKHDQLTLYNILHPIRRCTNAVFLQAMQMLSRGVGPERSEPGTS